MFSNSLSANDALDARLPLWVADTLVDTSAHPLLRAFPPKAASCVGQEGVRVRAEMNDRLPAEGRLRFVMSGAIGLFPEAPGACVAMVGPGGLLGLEQCFTTITGGESRVLVKAEWIEVPAAALTETMGREWAERMFAHQAAGRIRLLAAEAACNARHPVAQRLARWLLRLHEASGLGRRLEITQALLGEILGVQRTTVNAAIGALHQAGYIDNGRGRITVRNRQGLAAAACACGNLPRPGPSTVGSTI